MRIAVLAQPESWYYRDLARAAGDLRFECLRAEFPQLTAVVRSNHDTHVRNPDPHGPFSPASGEKVPKADEGVVTDVNDLKTISPAITRETNRPPHPNPLPRSGGEGTGDTVRLSDSAFPPDVLIVRTMSPGSLEQVVYRMDALARLEASGTEVVNSPKSLECAVDKYLTTSRCHAAGLPVPDTIVCETEEAALAAFAELGGDVVVKPLFGAEGRGILRVSDPDLALRTFRTLGRLQAVLYLQQFIPHPGFDVRVLVLDGEVLGGMKRIAADGDFRTNVSRQAHAERHAPTEQECDFARRAAGATGAWFAGVDLLYDRDGRCYVIEVNAVPGWKAFGRVNEIDIATVFLRRIAEKRQ